MPADVRGKILKYVSQSKTGLFDSHPSDSARIAAARAEAAPGIITVEAPATVLFKDYFTLARRTTLAFYQDRRGPEFSADHLVATESMVAHRGQAKADFEAASRFFQGLLDPVRPVFGDRISSAIDPDIAAEKILSARSVLMEHAGSARAAAAVFDKADNRLASIARVRALHQAGFTTVKAADFELPSADPAAIRQLQAEAQSQAEASRKALDKLLDITIRRLHLALAIETSAQTKPPVVAELGADPMDEPHDGYDLRDEAAPGSGDRLLDALNALRCAAGGVERLRQAFFEYGALLAQIKPEKNPELLIQTVMAGARRMAACLMELFNALRGTPYPYEHSEKGASIGRFALPNVPSSEDIGPLYGAAEEALNAVYSLYMRLMSDLAHRAERAEQAIGLEPLPSVPELEGA